MAKKATPTEGTTPTINPVVTRLIELGVEEAVANKIIDELGATKVEELNGLTEPDLIGVGMKPLPARTLIGTLQKRAMESAHATAPTGTFAYDTLLPQVPLNDSWLKDLKAGGVLKVEQSTVISAVRAALADKIGLYNIPSLLVKAMEAFADSNEEQVDPVYFKLRRELTKRNYGDIFAAIDGMDGSYVTETRKKELMNRINTILWDSIVNFYSTLKSWYENWASGAANPAMMMSALFATAPGTAGLTLPPGIMQPPDTGILRDEAAAVNDSLNKVFRGTGVQIAAALAYEAMQIRDTLSDTRLPSLIGVPNREQMLRQLGVAVSPTYPRLETNLTQFVLAIMQAPDMAGGNEELQFFGSLYMLGSQIPWNELSEAKRSKVTGIGGGNRL